MVIMEENDVKINGTLIWYYNVCHREVWLMIHQISPDQDNGFLELGRIISEESYKNNYKEVIIDNIIFDLVKTKNGNLIIGEVKKSSRFKDSSIMQLSYYLYNLKKNGIKASGELLFPKEKKKIIVELNEEMVSKIELCINNIRELALTKIPPNPEKNKYCKNCAYNYFCWS